MLVDDLLDLLTTGGAGTAGVDLFGGGVSDTPPECVGIAETGGLPSVYALGAGPGGVVYEQPRVQLFVRGLTYQSARAKAEQIAGVLDGLRDRLVNGVWYHWAQQVTPPLSLGRDENDRWLFSLNYDVRKEPSA